MDHIRPFRPKCIVCDQEFESAYEPMKFCSMGCRIRWVEDQARQARIKAADRKEE